MWLHDAICDRTDWRFYHPSVYHSLFQAWGASADISQTPCGQVSSLSHGCVGTQVHKCTCALLTLSACSVFRLHMELEKKKKKTEEKCSQRDRKLPLPPRAHADPSSIAARSGLRFPQEISVSLRSTDTSSQTHKLCQIFTAFLQQVELLDLGSLLVLHPEKHQKRSF